jgi:hypothetical protein
MSINAFPNPFTAVTLIQVRGSGRSAAGNAPVMVEMFDANGSRVSVRRTDTGTLARGLYCSAAGCSNGIYLCRVRLGAQILEKKLVVLR